ncbi:alpha/beta fold hydrolase [Salinimonas chungwhensis]|uniref:alpha/beta fold hydrolase n=1 Tax=Salinimonas chungwhensis TaxID=265425 RepID=UPI00038138EF|nr:alpha/beta hydrolase [Salinimonas chungwhensis]
MKAWPIMLLALFFTLATHAQRTNVDDYEQLKYDATLTGKPYPFEVHRVTISSQGNDLSMAYMYLPPKDDFPVVTLFHGKNFNGAYWQTTANWLSDQGYGVLMPDQIGFGKSDKPTDYQYSFAALANNTKTLLDKLNINKTIVVGHSMGGMLATRFSLMYGKTAQRLVLVNPIGLENYLIYENYPDVNTTYRSELKKMPEDIVNYQKKNYYDGKWNERYAEHAEFLIGWVQGPDWPILAKVSALTYDMLLTQPVIEEFKYLDLPVTLILGTRDRTAPGRDLKKSGIERELGRYDKLGQQIKQRNQAVTVVELEGLGHLPHIEDFDRFKSPFLEAIVRKTQQATELQSSD